MPGSLTTPGRPGARDDAPGCVAFRYLHGVGTRNRTLSRLNGWPMRPPVNASPKPSRATAHDSGPMWIANSFIVRDLHSLLLAGLPALRKSSLQWPTERTSLRRAATSLIGHSRTWEPKHAPSVDLKLALACLEKVIPWCRGRSVSFVLR